MTWRGIVVGFALVIAATSTASPQSADPQSADPQSADNGGDSSDAHPGGIRGAVGRMREWAREIQLIERLNGDVDGWYPRIGGITRGAGLAAGPGIRGKVLGDRLFLDLSGAISIKGYKALNANARWLQAFDKRVEMWTEFRYEDFPQEDFFGTGMSTTPATRTSYDLDGVDIRVRTLVKPRPWARVGGAIGYMRPDVGPGTDSHYPSIEEVFTDAEAPGLLEQPSFLHTTISGEIDYRDTGGNTASGGYYQGTYGTWNDVTLDAFDFWRFDLELVQYVPLVPSKTHVVSGRIGTSYVNNVPGHRVPFYTLAYVGGMDTIRSFREFRFKDENALWLSAEYKWRPRPFLSLTLFADAGETRANWENVDLKDMRTGYGFGVGFHSASQTIVRLDVGTGGGEGWQFFFKVRPSF